MADAVAAGGGAAAVDEPVLDDENAGRAQRSTDVMELHDAVVSEQNCPDLLPFKHALVERVGGFANQQETDLEGWRMEEPETGAERAADVIVMALYQLDLDRIRYLLASYLRVRLGKIRKYEGLMTAKKETYTKRMSRAELGFLERIHKLSTDHKQATVLGKLPKMVRKVPGLKEYAEPNMDKHVLCFVNEDQELVTDTEMIPLTRGETVAIRYSLIKEAVETGTARLI